MSTGPADSVRCRAAVLNGGRHVSHVHTEVGPPARGQIRVRLQGCGVCASNLPVWEGRDWFTYPLAAGAPGHEGWGLVDAVGDGVAGVCAGDRVALLSSKAYAQYDLTDADSIVRLPPALSERPVPGEPLGCAMNIFRRADVRRGQTVAIVGIGFIGAVLTALCRRAGARVIALSRRRFALETAERFGASAGIELGGPARACREARRIGGAEGFPRVIEAVGSQLALDVASELTGTGGRLVIAGYHQDGSRTVDMQRWNWRGIDVVNAHERDPAKYRDGMQRAVELVASGELDPGPLYTHQYALREIGAAFETLAERPPGFIKALIACE